ncbi:hypothetical protein T08_10547 [Trichinella sp. T8]|nr:hypothetical protein T08_10547 [Trichinella sp. T8]
MASWRSLKKLQWNIRKEEDIVPFAVSSKKPLKEKTTRSPGKEKTLTGLEEEEVEVERSTGCKERTEEGAKYLTSGYALSYASGKFFKKIPAGYAPGNASGKIFALRLCSGQRLRQNFHNCENQSEEAVDHVSLYLRPFAFGAPTGGNAPCSNMFGTLSTISSHYKIKKQDSGNGQ